MDHLVWLEVGYISIEDLQKEFGEYRLYDNSKRRDGLGSHESTYTFLASPDSCNLGTHVGSIWVCLPLV